MHLSFGYDKTTLHYDIPDENLIDILTPNETPAALTGEEEVMRALQAPIGTPRLREIVKPGEKIAIVTSDITRPMPTYAVLPHVAQELSLAGVRDEDVTVVFALGIHREMTPEEMKQAVGEEMYRRFACLNACRDYTHLGTSQNGTPIDIFTPVAEADRIICLGNIEYHYFAGYSGGAKAIMPGVSTHDAIQANHKRMVDERAHAGNLATNPVRLDIDEVGSFVHIDFIVNVVLDEHKKIRHCVAGHYIEAHRAGCRLLDKMYQVEIPAKADIVITSPGGFPKDLNLYQAQKALDNAKHAVRDGGVIVWLAAAGEGLGESTFEKWMLGHEKSRDMIDHINREFELGGHKAAAIAMVLEKCRILFVSDLPAEFVRRIHLEPFATLEDAMAEAFRAMGEDARVIAMPYGGSTLPVLSSDRSQTASV